MKIRLFVLIALLWTASATAATRPTPTPTYAPAPTSTATSMPITNGTLTIQNGVMTILIPVPSATPTPTDTPTSTPTVTPTATPTPTPTVTSTPTPTGVPTQASGFWQIQPTAVGWWFALGDQRVCKYEGLSLVDTTFAPPGLVGPSGTYPDNVAFAAAQDARLKSWGFNSAGMYSYAYYGGYKPGTGQLPYVPTITMASVATRNSQPYHIKSVYQHNPLQKCSAVIYYGIQADPFEPAFQSDATTIFSTQTKWPTGNPSAALFMLPEEADQMFGMDAVNSHTDMGYMIASTSPMQVNDNPAPLGPNKTPFVYPDHTLYAKLALRDWLTTKYGSIAGLNAAWGTSYTTFDTTDPGGAAGISSGSYASYGTGTGFLDEAGANLLITGLNCNNIKANLSWSKNPTIQTDVDNFVSDVFALTYAQKENAALAAGYPNGHPPVILPLYNGPEEVYTTMAPYYDGFWTNGGNQASRLQTIINAFNKPVIVGDYSVANPDSPLSATVVPPNSCGNPNCFIYNTQADRGSGMVAWWKSILPLKNLQGKYPVIGIEHWQEYDNNNEKRNFGMVTSTKNNPYDGSANIANGETANYGDALTPIKTFLSGNLCDVSPP